MTDPHQLDNRIKYGVVRGWHDCCLPAHQATRAQSQLWKIKDVLRIARRRNLAKPLPAPDMHRLRLIYMLRRGWLARALD